MTAGADGPERPAGPTVADALNGFRKSGELAGNRAGEVGRQPDPAPSPRPAPPATSAPAPPTEPADAALVRPYAWTGGRTRSRCHLAVETLVSTSERASAGAELSKAEHHAVADLCREPRSVAEVAALLSLPLGVARVLIGDMAGLGLVVIHETASRAGDVPDLDLMERVLSGLRRL